MTGPNGDFAVILNGYETNVLFHYFYEQKLPWKVKAIYQRLIKELSLHNHLSTIDDVFTRSRLAELEARTEI